ncbi:MAG TPA: urease accessory UreF family protein, partial [Verrucomicrobiae bacterium]|nr:urease accessory UreF family protein [Verrucomicrobiae bacterium]
MPPLEAKTSASDWLIWQLADSAFPAGGFAHSGGVEATRQQHELRGRDHLIEFLEAALAQAGRSSLPFVSVAFDAANDFAWTDHLCDAFTTNHVTNRASRLQGHAFLASCERAFCRDAITALRTEVDGQELPGHFAPVFGAICHALHLERGAALRLFLFNQLRSWLSSAVRLGIVGPIDAQTIQ